MKGVVMARQSTEAGRREAACLKNDIALPMNDAVVFDEIANQLVRLERVPQSPSTFGSMFAVLGFSVAAS